jgi:hypothetical protein
MGRNNHVKPVKAAVTSRTIYRFPILFVSMALLISGCVTPPTSTAGDRAAPPPSVEVYFYPTKGQSQEQQERDRYECSLWAKEKTGFDPSLPGLAPSQRVQVEPKTQSGQKAATGALIGASSEAADEAAAQRAQQEQQARTDARITKQAEDYRRAMSACLEGRGYKVK